MAMGSSTPNWSKFQSTPPHGGRPAAGRRGEFTGRFQSTPPHGGRPGDHGSLAYAAWFQSTPPHGGRRPGQGPHRVREGVSIHAPARGATCPRPAGSRHLPVSIHAPARGATRPACPAVARPRCFNPRPRTGGATIDGVLRRQVRQVSIHAPARGATRPMTLTGRPSSFQSTPPHGGRPARSTSGDEHTTRFNPRPRTGGDDPR